jgi:hypothetical protein
MLSHGFIYGFLAVCFAGAIISEYPKTTLYILFIAFVFSIYKLLKTINTPKSERDEDNLI